MIDFSNIRLDFDALLSVLKYNPKSPLLFNSGFFLLFFCLFLLFYSLVQNRIRQRIWFIVIVSIYFYYKSSGWYFLLMLATSFVAHFVAIKIYLSRNKRLRKLLLTGSIVLFLGLLFYFKYSNFFIDIVNQFGTTKIDFIKVFLPLGISFYTFELISYVVDVYYYKVKPVKRLVDFSFYVSFFPHLVAGPIVRPKDLIPQMYAKIYITQQQMGQAVYYICMGLFKKAVISDYISSNFVDRIFDNPTLYSGVENLLGAYGYTLQIYCDFSGYSDMAIGIALLMGFHLPNNFDTPYQSSSITEFWRRWHISLSSWLRDYLYISLGGNRKGKIRTYFNLFITMLLGGLWHGASWKFVFWGAMHGTGLVIEKMLTSMIRIKQNFVTHKIGMLFTFHFVTFCWIFFRATSFDSAWAMLHQIVTNFDVNSLQQVVVGYQTVFIFIGIGYLLHFLPKAVDTFTESLIIKTPFLLQAVYLAAFIWLVIQVKSADVQPFIYFQF